MNSFSLNKVEQEKFNQISEIFRSMNVPSQYKVLRLCAHMMSRRLVKFGQVEARVAAVRAAGESPAPRSAAKKSKTSKRPQPKRKAKREHPFASTPEGKRILAARKEAVDKLNQLIQTFTDVKDTSKARSVKPSNVPSEQRPQFEVLKSEISRLSTEFRNGMNQFESIASKNPQSGSRNRGNNPDAGQDTKQAASNAKPNAVGNSTKAEGDSITPKDTGILDTIFGFSTDQKGGKNPVAYATKVISANLGSVDAYVKMGSRYQPLNGPTFQRIVRALPDGNDGVMNCIIGLFTGWDNLPQICSQDTYSPVQLWEAYKALPCNVRQGVRGLIATLPSFKKFFKKKKVVKKINS
jgi:hypothetical protein